MLRLYVITLVFIFGSKSAEAQISKQVESEINHLLASVEASNCSFERNGTIHKAKKAAQHLRDKFKNASDSWFAPDPKKWTTDMFIEKIASKSSLSGDPYWIICDDHKKTKSEDWLKAALKKFRREKR